MKSPLVSAVLATALFALPAFAVSSSSAQFNFDVVFDRSSLDDGASVSSEYQRISKQVSHRCEAENKGFNPIRKIAAVKNCVRFAMDDVIREIDHDGLTAYHRSQKSR